MNLFEIGYSIHINQRIKERTKNIKSLDIPEDFFQPEDDVDYIKKIVKQKIEIELARRLIILRDTDYPFNEALVYKLMLPVLKRNGKSYKLTLTTESEDENKQLKEYTGDLYIVIIASNVGITIMNVDSNLNKSELDKRLIPFIKNPLHRGIEQFKDLKFEIVYEEEFKSLPMIQAGAKTTEMGEGSFKKYMEIMKYNPSKEKSPSKLFDKKEEIEIFIKNNIKRLSQQELKNLNQTKEQIDFRLEQIQSTSERVVAKLKQKADYRKGAKYTHSKFGKGTILSTKKVDDGIYDIEIQFDDFDPITKKPFGVKKLRVGTKEKPSEQPSPGLNESIRKFIRKMLEN